MTAQQIEAKHGVKSYRRWEQVPIYLLTRTGIWREYKIHIPFDAKPDGVKNAADATSKNRDKVYFLFDVRKFMSA